MPHRQQHKPTPGKSHHGILLKTSERDQSASVKPSDSSQRRTSSQGFLEVSQIIGANAVHHKCMKGEVAGLLVDNCQAQVSKTVPH